MSKLIEQLEKEGYYDMREIPSRGLCGLMRYIFTVGLVCGLTEWRLEGRYCYSKNADAKDALKEWDGVGDPKDTDWIKHKGKTEYSNPNKENEKYN